jgi:hypothetical protein
MSTKSEDRQYDALLKVIARFESGLSFVVGDVTIRPKWEDLHRALWHLVDMNIASKVLPSNIPAEILLSGNKEQIHSLIPLIVQNTYALYATGREVLPTNNAYYRLAVMMWLVRCYWHYELLGPKPVMTASTNFKTRNRKFADTWHPTYNCPECGKPFIVPPKIVKRETIMRLYVKWMVVHSNEYHHYALPEYVIPKKSRKVKGE